MSSGYSPGSSHAECTRPVYCEILFAGFLNMMERGVSIDISFSLVVAIAISCKVEVAIPICSKEELAIPISLGRECHSFSTHIFIELGINNAAISKC